MINGILRVKRKFKNSLVYEISYSHGILRSGRRESDKKSSYTHGILRVEIWVNSSGHQLQSRNFVPREKFELLFVGAKKENQEDVFMTPRWCQLMPRAQAKMRSAQCLRNVPRNDGKIRLSTVFHASLQVLLRYKFLC